MKDNYQVNKKYLRKFKRVSQKIEYLKRRIEEVDSKLNRTKSFDPQIERIEGGYDQNRIDDLISLKDSLERRLRNQLEKSWSLRDSRMRAIDTIQSEVESQVLEMYYIDLDDLDTIASKLHLSTRTVRRAYNNGLRIMEPQSED